jgi:hypothetical protein
MTKHAVPGQVELASPANLETGLPLRPTLTWNQPAGVVVGYYIYIGTDENPYNRTDPEVNRIAIIIGGENTTWTFDSDLENNTTYHWQIVAFNETGEGEPSESWSFIVNIVSDFDIENIPTITALIGNFPNPFNPETIIRFSLGNNEHVSIEVYNIRGQKVRSLVNDYMSTGTHQVLWNGTDDYGQTVGSGIYLYVMRAGDYHSTQRMILMK